MTMSYTSEHANTRSRGHDRNNRRITPCLHVNECLANTSQECTLAGHRRYTCNDYKEPNSSDPQNINNSVSTTTTKQHEKIG